MSYKIIYNDEECDRVFNSYEEAVNAVDEFLCNVLYDVCEDKYEREDIMWSFR